MLIERIKNNLVMETIVDFDDIKVFGNVSGKHMIHTYRKEQTSKSEKIRFYKLDNSSFNQKIEETKPSQITYSKIFDNGNISFDIDVVNYKKCKKLGMFFDVSQGVVEAADKVSNKMLNKVQDDKFKAGDGVFVISKQEKNDLNLNDDEKKVIKKYLDTNDVGKYVIKFNDEYLIYSNKSNRDLIKKNKFSNLKKHLDKMKKFITSSNKPYGLHRSREEKNGDADFFDKPKLICKGMFLTPEFAYDDNKYYVGMSFSVIIQKDDNYSLKYLLGLLNSKFGQYWFNKHGKRRGVGVDIGVEMFRQFPVCVATEAEQNQIINKVDEIIQIRYTDTTRLDDTEIRKLENDYLSKEIELNDLIFKLYEFEPEEVEEIKEMTNN